MIIFVGKISLNVVIKFGGKIKLFPIHANNICLLQVMEFKDKWFKECSPIFDEKCKTK